MRLETPSPPTERPPSGRGRAAPTRGDEISRVARRAGISRKVASVETIDARRVQLWAIVSAVLVGLGLMMAVLSVRTGDDSIRTVITAQPAFRFGLVLVLAGFAGYIFEQERQLRRLTRLLVEERITVDVERSRAAWLTETDRLKSDFVTTVDRDLSGALDRLAETVTLIQHGARDGAEREAYVRLLVHDVENARTLLGRAVVDHDHAMIDLASHAATGEEG